MRTAGSMMMWPRRSGDAGSLGKCPMLCWGGWRAPDWTPGFLCVYVNRLIHTYANSSRVRSAIHVFEVMSDDDSADTLLLSLIPLLW